MTSWLDISRFAHELAQVRIPHETVKWFKQERTDRLRILKVLTEIETIEKEDILINEEN